MENKRYFGQQCSTEKTEDLDIEVGQTLKEFQKEQAKILKKKNDLPKPEKMFIKLGKYKKTKKKKKKNGILEFVKGI